MTEPPDNHDRVAAASRTFAKAKRTSRRKRHGRRHEHVGAAPGTLFIDPQAPLPVIRAFAYGPDTASERTVDAPAQLTRSLESAPVVWINVDGLGNELVLRQIADVFNIHRLLLEDIVNVDQRPKIEQHAEHLFVVLRMVGPAEDGRLRFEQLSLLVGEGFVLSFQERPGDCFDPVRARIRRSGSRLRESAADYLAYALVDTLIDRYFPFVDPLNERLDQLEEEMTAGRAEAEMLGDLHRVKRDLFALRRTVLPMRDAVASLMRLDTPVIREGTRKYLRDVVDHATQLVELVDTSRELATGLGDLHMSIVNQRMNEVMKVLTIIATLFIPLSFIAGIYGMNFNPERSPINMPETQWYWGYPFALGLMAVVALGLLFFFRRRGWL